MKCETNNFSTDLHWVMHQFPFDLVDTVIRLGGGLYIGDTFTGVYMYNFQNIVVCFGNNIKLWEITIFSQNNFPEIIVCKQGSCYF